MSKDALFRAAKTASLIAALALVAQSEWALALAVGWPAWIAWAAPVALDAYVLAAVTAHRDLGPSVIVSSASVFGSHAVYAAPAAWEGGTAGAGHLIWWMAAGCSVVPLLVTWRVHHLTMPAPVAVEVEPILPVLLPQSPPVEESARPAARAAKASGKPGVIPDADLARVVRETVTSHAVGWGTVKAAIEAGGWSVGNTGRVKTAISQRKADLPDEPRRGLSAVGG